MQNLIIIIFLLFISKIGAQDLVTLDVNPTCSSICTGSINITIDPSQLDPDQTLPFEIELTNINTQEIIDYRMNQYQYNIIFLCSGDYEIVIHLSEYCTYSNTVTIEAVDQTSLSTSVNIQHTTIGYQCEDGAIDLTVNGGYAPYAYQWEYSIDGGTSFYAGNTQDISNLRGGYTYCVTVTDDYCGSVSQCWDVNCCYDIMISSDVTHATNSGDCDDGAIDISVSGGGPGYSYMWSYDDGSGPRSFGSTEGNISQLRNYTYCVTVTDQNCGATSSSCMDVLRCPDVPEETVTNICKVNELGAIRLDVSGGYSYYVDWYDSNGNSLAGSDSGIDQLQAGTYTAIFTTLGNNCTFTRSYEVLSNVISVEMVDIENPSCYGFDDDGMITISVDTDGNIPYTVNWYESIGGYPYGGAIGTGTMLSNIEEGEYVAVITTEFCTIMAGPYRLICCIKEDKNGDPQSTLPFPAFVNVVTNWESSDGACDGSISFGTNIPNYVEKKITIKKMPENI